MIEVIREIEIELEKVEPPVKWQELVDRFKRKASERFSPKGSGASGKATHETFRRFVDRREQITVRALKCYLSLREDVDRSDVWRTALELRNMTYASQQEEVKLPADIDQVRKRLAKEKAEWRRKRSPEKTIDEEKTAKSKSGTTSTEGGTMEGSITRSTTGPLMSTDPFALERNLTEEQLVRFARYKSEVDAAKSKQPVWDDSDVIPSTLLERVAAAERHALKEREKLQTRGLPAELYLEGDKIEKVDYLPEKSKLQEDLSPLGDYGVVITNILTSKPPTVGVAFLRGQIARLLADIALHWAKIKPDGQHAIINLGLKKTLDIGDAKGAVGELTGVLFAVREGAQVNTGGKDKRLPNDLTIGGISSQDIDIRYVKGGNTRVYMEAKYDAKTLIDKYEGETLQVMKVATATTQGAAESKGPGTTTSPTAITASEGTLEELESEATSKPAPLVSPSSSGASSPLGSVTGSSKLPVPKVKSHQQQRYEAMATKSFKGGGPISKRELYAIVANNHDWLLLFIPGGAGKRVAGWLADANWTIVIKDQPIDPSLNRALLDAVPEYYYKSFEVGLTKLKPEAWAESVSREHTPSEFLKLARSGT